MRMPEKRYSVCTLVRTDLGIRGKTHHSGRGYYEMEHDAGKDLPRLFRSAAENWEARGLLARPLITKPDGSMVAVFKPELTFDGWYRRVRCMNTRLVVSMGVAEDEA